MENGFLSTFSRLVGGKSAAAGVPAESVTSDEAVVEGREALDKIAYLSAMRIFRDLSPGEMKMIVDSAVMTTAPKGKLIYMPGETGEVLFLLKTGSVHLYRLSSEGRKFIVQTIGPMTFFGEMSTVSQNMQDLFAEASEDCLICVMGRADVERLILSKPRVALRILEEIGQRMRDIQERLGDCALKGVPARVASLLLRLTHGGSEPITGLTHQHLADMVGAYRETLTTTLGQLRDKGLIEIGRKRISILRPEELRITAEEEVLRKR